MAADHHLRGRRQQRSSASTLRTGLGRQNGCRKPSRHTIGRRFGAPPALFRIWQLGQAQAALALLGVAHELPTSLAVLRAVALHHSAACREHLGQTAAALGENGVSAEASTEEPQRVQDEVMSAASEVLSPSTPPMDVAAVALAVELESL